MKTKISKPVIGTIALGISGGVVMYFGAKASKYGGKQTIISVIIGVIVGGLIGYAISDKTPTVVDTGIVHDASDKDQPTK